MFDYSNDTDRVWAKLGRRTGETAVTITDERRPGAAAQEPLP